MSRGAPVDSTGVLLALAAYGMWGFAPAYWKALSGHSATELLAHRVIWSLLLGILLLLATRGVREFGRLLRSRRHALPMALTAGLLAINWGTFIWSVNAGDVLATSLGYYINPLMSVVLGLVVLRERLTRAQAIAVAIAAAGVLQHALSLGSLPWVSVVLAVTFALYGLFRKMAPVAPVQGFALEMALLAPLGLAYLGWLVASGEATLPSGDTQVDGLTVGTALLTAGPLLCFNGAAKRLPLSLVGIFQYIAPSLALLLAVGLYGETFTRTHAITFGCVWLALGIFTLDSLRFTRGARAPDAGDA